MRTSSFLLSVLLYTVACSALSIGAEQATNVKCPVLVDEDVDPDIWVKYQGQKVFLCCEDCRRQFLEDPKKFIAKLPQFAATHPSSTTPSTAPQPAATAPDSMRPSFWRYVGKFHPLLVHFPIALIFCATISELLFWRTTKQMYADGAHLMLIFGALGGIAATALGWLAAANVKHPAELLAILERHRWWGLATTVLMVLAAGLAMANPRSAASRAAYRVLVLLALFTVALTGFLGASLVFGPNHLAW